MHLTGTYIKIHAIQHLHGAKRNTDTAHINQGTPVIH